MPNSLYKPGDKVTIVYFKPELYYRGGVNRHMKEISGTIQEIESIEYDDYMLHAPRPEFEKEKIYYKLKGSEWSWSCEMFEESYEI